MHTRTEGMLANKVSKAFPLSSSLSFSSSSSEAVVLAGDRGSFLVLFGAIFQASQKKTGRKVEKTNQTQQTTLTVRLTTCVDVAWIPGPEEAKV